jgi:hypothetical protein
VREYKFRGISVLEERWVFGDLVHGNGYIMISVTEKFNNYNKIKYITVKPETVGQFIGQFDDNEKEIYEGDFVLIRKFCDEDGCIECKVIFDNDSSSFLFEEVGKEFNTYNINEPVESYFNGTVHDNPGPIIHNEELAK